MTIEKTKETIAVMQAYVDGKEIELNWGDGWQPAPNPNWDWKFGKFRIKPTPIEGWVNVYAGGLSTVYESKEAAIHYGEGAAVKIIKVREVEE